MLLSYFWFYDVLNFFFFFLAACVLWVKAAQTSGWPGLIQKLLQTLIDSVLFFFLSNVYCQWWMYLFLVLPSPLQRITLSVWDWGGGRTPLFFLFCFFLFVLRIWSWESKMRHKTAINHDLWSWLFVGELILFFPTQRKWSMAFSIFFLSYTWQSVRFLFHVIHYGCLFFARVFFLSSHWMTAHQGSWTLTPCVCLWTRAGHWDLPVQKGGYCIFSSLLFLGVAMLLPLKKTKNKIFT